MVNGNTSAAPETEHDVSLTEPEIMGHYQIWAPADPTVLRIMPNLAEEIGLNESIVLLQIDYWIRHSNNVRDGRRWTYQSLHGMQQKAFKWWSKDTIGRAIASLKAQNMTRLLLMPLTLMAILLPAVSTAAPPHKPALERSERRIPAPLPSCNRPPSDMPPAPDGCPDYAPIAPPPAPIPPPCIVEARVEQWNEDDATVTEFSTYVDHPETCPEPCRRIASGARTYTKLTHIQHSAFSYSAFRMGTGRCRLGGQLRQRRGAPGLGTL